MISIIIPNYNRVHYLKECLLSVIAQTYTSWEALVVDDGSVDASKALVKSLAETDDRVHWIERTTPKKGAAACRNIGIHNANGEYVVFLDSDDLLAPHCLNQRVEIMKSHPQLDFAVFKMQFFQNQQGDDSRVWNLENGQDVLQRFLNLDPVWQTTGPIWKRLALLKMGGFDENLHCWQDIHIHLKALIEKLNYTLFYDLPIDCYYRKNALESISQSNTNSPEKLKSKALLYHWVVSHLDHKTYGHEQMGIHILVSAVNANNKAFFDVFYSDIKAVLSQKTLESIKQMSRLHFYKLTKLKHFQKLYNTIKYQIILPSQIGKYNTNET